MNTPLAFPAQFWDERATGMTLRDYFAAKAMQGMFASDTKDWNSQQEWQTRAEVAYSMADEMIQVREA